jgi:cytidine deaminase
VRNPTVPFDDAAKTSLLERAHEALDLAYAPYSGTRIAAALLAVTGRTYVGANIGNASSALNCCAEQVALSHAVMAGDVAWSGIAVVQRPSVVTVPCGRCLQLLSEFAEDLPILSDGPEGRVEWRLRELLPVPFRRAKIDGP